ncbi:MAG: hypothetical protein U1G07_15100 [Verrucomicrobiota bacterium]
MRFHSALAARQDVHPQHHDIVPDMLVLGKGLGGGVFPMAALLARRPQPRHARTLSATTRMKT